MGAGSWAEVGATGGAGRSGSWLQKKAGAIAPTWIAPKVWTPHPARPAHLDHLDRPQGLDTARRRIWAPQQKTPQAGTSTRQPQGEKNGTLYENQSGRQGSSVLRTCLYPILAAFEPHLPVKRVPRPQPDSRWNPLARLPRAKAGATTHWLPEPALLSSVVLLLLNVSPCVHAKICPFYTSDPADKLRRVHFGGIPTPPLQITT